MGELSANVRRGKVCLLCTSTRASTRTAACQYWFTQIQKYAADPPRLTLKENHRAMCIIPNWISAYVANISSSISRIIFPLGSFVCMHKMHVAQLCAKLDWAMSISYMYVYECNGDYSTWLNSSSLLSSSLPSSVRSALCSYT